MSLQVYRLRSDPESFAWLHAVGQGGFDQIEPLRSAASCAETWVPFEITKLVDEPRDEGLVLPDYPTFPAPAFSERAVAALSDLLAPHGELLPVEGLPYLLYNVLQLEDALDEEASTLKRFSSSGRIMRLDRPVFVPDRLGPSPIFKLPTYRRVDVYVRQPFVDRVEETGLTGFRFEPLWPTFSPFPSPLRV